MANLYPAIITAFFADKNGNPQTGLRPAICIYQITSVTGSPQGDVLVVGGGSPEVFMTEIGKGFYKYVFTGYNSQLKYAYQIDGEAGGTGAKLGLGRYVVGTNENFAEDVAYEVWEEPKNLHLTGSPETMGSVLNQILTATLGSPQAPLTVSNIVSGIWNELLAGSPAPYPTGSAGGLINQIAQSAGLTPAQVTAAVWDVSAADYPSSGSPQTMGSLHTATHANTLSLIEFSEALLAAQYNRTFLDKGAATLTIYADDNVTPIRVFSLRDSTGTPSITEIVDRVPISGSPLLPIP